LSKNFELLRKLGKDQALLQTSKSVQIPDNESARSLSNTADYSEPLKATRSRREDGRGHDSIRGNKSTGHLAQSPDLEAITNAEEIKLVQRLFLMPDSDERRLVLFASVDAAHASSSICARAGEVLASHTKASVCLVDADFSSPSLHWYFGVKDAPGLFNALEGGHSLGKFAQPLPGNNLWLIPCGSPVTNLNGFLDSAAFRSRVQELRAGFEYVFIRTPPLAFYPEAVLLAPSTDGVVLVIEANTTRRQAASKVKSSLEAVEGRLLGVVLNNRTFPIPEFLYRRL
jgi:Mrp family chromosome partitioning ATPase